MKKAESFEDSAFFFLKGKIKLQKEAFHGLK